MNHRAQQCRSSGRRNSSTGRSPSLEGHRIDRDDSAVTSQTKAEDVKEAVASRNLLPKDQAAVMAEEEASPSRQMS